MSEQLPVLDYRLKMCKESVSDWRYLSLVYVERNGSLNKDLEAL